MLFTEEEQRKGEPEIELTEARERGQHSSEGFRRKKDGSLFWASVTLTAIYNDTDELIGFTKVTRDLSDKRQADEALRHTHEELATISRLHQSIVT